jgi:hypothetical protein
MNTKTELCLLFEKYGVDKCPSILHSYSPEYFKILNPIRSNLKTMLEIGIGNKTLMCPIVGKDYEPGASLRAFNVFFYNCDYIFGVDIDKSVFFKHDKIKCLYMDQNSVDSIRNTIASINDIINKTPSFDLIIDDGSHIKDHMSLSYNTLKSCLGIGGLYIIEDIKLKDLDFFTNLGHNDNIMKIDYIHTGAFDQDCFVAYRRIK